MLPVKEGSNNDQPPPSLRAELGYYFNPANALNTFVSSPPLPEVLGWKNFLKEEGILFGLISTSWYGISEGTIKLFESLNIQELSYRGFVALAVGEVAAVYASVVVGRTLLSRYLHI